MFKGIDDSGFEKADPVLELQVKVLNLNEGRNEAIAKRCGLLAQYSTFVSKVRDFEKEGYTREESMKKAVVYCRNHDILKELLEKNAGEVLNMLMTEWNWDDALDVRYEEGREEGIEQGIEIGIEKGIEQGIEKGREKEREESHEYFLKLLDQGLSVDEIKRLLQNWNLNPNNEHPEENLHVWSKGGVIPAAPAMETRLIFAPAGGIICYTFLVVAEVIPPPLLHI